jgi:uncharacterized membrane protein YgcG
MRGIGIFSRGRHRAKSPKRLDGEAKKGTAELRNIDFSSWHSLLATLIGLALFTLISIGIRLLMMFTIQQRRERANRQINERLRTLIAAYKTLGGSFTGDLAVDPTHRRDLRRAGTTDAEAQAVAAVDLAPGGRSDRRRRIRDAVEAALSDILLLGTEEQVRLAERAIRELVAGRPVHVQELVVSLRDFIRSALGLAPIPADLAIPMQGPTRPSGSRSSGKGGQEGGRGRGGGSGMGGGMGMGGGLGTAGNDDDPSSSGHST